ncbi:unnamed protein product [Brassicogethes aeneus]|uniref:Uncharacterized protein n=1 Tax=Brassicogethes aeneus TaxID=1431903 RepID=A0A9P0FFK1_BRAAE|nr:unnamed protein product [Brassicogethes aeneus]
MAPSDDKSESAVCKNPCKRCKNIPVTGGVVCINCGNSMHPSCAKKLTHVKFTNENSIICCERELDISFASATSNDENDSTVLTNMDSKDLEIKYLKKLNAQFQLSDQLLQYKKIPIAPSTGQKPNRINDATLKANTLVRSETKQPIDKRQHQNGGLINKTNQQPIKFTPKVVADAINKANLLQKPLNGDIVPQTSDSTKDSSDWKTINRKSHGRPKTVPIIGTAADSMSKLCPDTTVDQLTNFLCPKFPEVTCELLNSRNPRIYSSFKITIKKDQLENAMESSTWPAHTRVARFFHPRRQPQPLS